MTAPRRRNNPRGGSPTPNQRHAGPDFWGSVHDPAEPPVAAVRIRPTSDPAAVPRSLGDPPLGASPAVISHHLSVVYEEAVRAATALAAANGLLADEPWAGDDQDD